MKTIATAPLPAASETQILQYARQGTLPTPTAHAKSWGGLYLVAVIVLGLLLIKLWNKPYDLATLGLLLVLNFGAFGKRLDARLTQLTP